MFKTLEELIAIIRQRKTSPTEESYTNKLLKDKDYLSKILINGSKKADLIAKDNLKEIYDIIGLKKFS